MSADRYEITDDGASGFYITKLGLGYSQHTAGISADAIRQQARDIDQLRADLAAAVAERDEARRHAQDLTECAMKTIPADWRPGYAWTDDGVMNVLAEYVIELRKRAERAEARLAAIEAAPTVALVEGGDGFRYLSWGQLPPVDTQLIARPAKDHL